MNILHIFITTQTNTHNEKVLNVWRQHNHQRDGFDTHAAGEAVVRVLLRQLSLKFFHTTITMLLLLMMMQQID